MERWMVLVIAGALILGGCTFAGISSRKATSDNTQTSEAPPAASRTGPTLVPDHKPEEIAQCRDHNTGELAAAGVKLRSHADSVLAQFGNPDEVDNAPRYGDSEYRYPFGTILVLKDRQINEMMLWGDPPMGELWPGIRFGSPRTVVLAYFADRGLCGILRSDNKVTIPHAAGWDMDLSFTTEGLLREVSLYEAGIR